MAYNGQISFGIIAILYKYQVSKTLFGPIKPTNPSVQIAYKSQNSFRKPAPSPLIPASLSPPPDGK